MTKVNRLGMFADIREVLDSALAHGGGEFECPTHGAAVQWRHRAYQFRKHYAEVLGPKAMSPYDVLVLPRLGPEDCVVRINIRQAAGVFRPAGPALSSSETLPLNDDELMQAAAALAARIEGEGQ